MKYIFLFLLGFILCNGALAQRAAPAGNLFIIGGGDRPAELIAQMIATANLQKKDYIVVLPMASIEPEASFAAIRTQMQAATTKKITCFNFTPATVQNKNWVDSLRRAKLIFITGGSQDRFMHVVLNTPVYAAIHQAYASGGTIAGTSAGAAVMSQYMITGQQLAGDTTYRETFNKLWDNNIAFSQGLGLLDSTIIDQHFIKRSRYNRLFSALAAHPQFNCIGIDEATAIIVHRKNVKVVGQSQVIYAAEPEKLAVDASGLLKMKDMRLSIYTNGDCFELQ